jgi:hypothetical protein
MGVIEWFEYYDFDGDPVLVVDYVASKVVRASGMSANDMAKAINRIFPLDESKGVNLNWGDTKGEEEDDYPTSAFAHTYNIARAQNLLNEYGPLVFQQPEDKKAVLKRINLAKKMITTLKLDKKGTHASESRLETACGEAQWFIREYGKPMEGIGRVCCMFCGKRSIFRLTLWEAPEPDFARVYRIPGLVYDDSVPEGVGMVVLGKRVIGKLMYGTPACDCKRMEFVELGDLDFESLTT